MKYVENNILNRISTSLKLSEIMRGTKAIVENTACKVSGDKRYDGRIAARALYAEIAACEAMLEEIDEQTREKALGDIRAGLDVKKSQRAQEMLAAVFFGR